MYIKSEGPCIGSVLPIKDSYASDEKNSFHDRVKNTFTVGKTSHTVHRSQLAFGTGKMGKKVFIGRGRLEKEASRLEMHEKNRLCRDLCLTCRYK